MATSWFARFYQPHGQTGVLPGTTVRVIGRQGLTLLVMTVEDADVQPQMLVGDRVEVNHSGLLRLVQQVGSAFSKALLHEERLRRVETW